MPDEKKPNLNPLNITPEQWEQAVKETEQQEREHDEWIRQRIEEGRKRRRESGEAEPGE